MSEPTHGNPVAVPWTPDMMAQKAPVPTQNPNQFPTAGAPAPLQPAPAPNQPMVQNGPARPNAQPQSYAPQPAPQAPTSYGQPQMMPPQHAAYQAAPAQNTYVQNDHGQPEFAAPAHPYPHQQAQPQQSFQQAPTYAAPQQSQPSAIPPLPAPHMQRPRMQRADAPVESSSILGRLLKRSPKPGHADANIYADQMAAETQSYTQRVMPRSDSVPQANPKMRPASGSLFNRNFVLGAVTGLIVGAFVLPMVLNLFAGGDQPQQSQALAAVESSSSFDETEGTPDTDLNVPTGEQGQTFLDAAISADES